VIDVVRWGGFVVGLALVAGAGASLFRQLVVPRGVNSRLGRFVDAVVRLLVRSVLALWASQRRSDPQGYFERADRLLAIAGPATLVVLLATWMAGLILGFALMIWPLARGSFPDALRESGSSFLTLGFFQPTSSATGIDMVCAASGIVTIALLIGYLPTLYAAFSRRETLVTTLEARAGSPAWGPEILARTVLVGLLEEVPNLYRDWEQWAAEVAESHANYPFLLRFRSPNPYRSWILALVAVMDSAALYLALAPERAPFEARLCLRMGFTALRDIATSVGLRFDPDPLPTDPIGLPYEEFLRGVDRLTAAGFPVERSAEQAWRDFRGWRVNYEPLAWRIADLVDAPPAPWSGPRTQFPGVIEPRRPVDRRPDDVEGRRRLGRYLSEEAGSPRKR